MKKRPQNMSTQENIEWVMNNELQYEPEDLEKDCWVARDSRCLGKDGRPRYYWKGKNWLLYRLMWCQWNDCEFPVGLDARHLCGNPRCINPLHIEPGTQQENEADKPKKTYEEHLSYQTKLPRTPSGLSQEEKVDFWLEHHTRDEGDCKIWLGQTGADGYGRRGVMVAKGVKKKVEVHRWIYSVKKDISYSGAWIARHTCNTRGCVNPEHIEPGSRSQNARDMRAYSKNTKLTEEQVRGIIEEIVATPSWPRGSKKEFQKKYAEAYGVSIDAINNIMIKRRWKDIWEEYEGAN